MGDNQNTNGDDRDQPKVSVYWDTGATGPIALMGPMAGPTAPILGDLALFPRQNRWGQDQIQC
jgi:hypothetical protein